jgi:hypothetical protein
MSIFKKKQKTIPDGNYRIIKIGKDAIYEILREYITDHQEIFFDVTDGTKIVKHFDINWDTGAFICAARNDYGDDEHLQCNIDIAELLSKLKDTTETLFTDKRYMELSEEEIKNLP